MEKLIIKNFGPIKDAEVELRDILILIGPQASGKSTIAKLFYFFKRIPEKLAEFIYNEIYINKRFFEKPDDIEFKFFIIKEFQKTFPVEYLSNNEIHIEYTYSNNFQLSIYNRTEYAISFSFNHDFQNKIDKILQEHRESVDQDESKYLMSLDILARVLKEFDLWDYDSLYIPAGRGSINSLSSIVNPFLIEENRNIDTITQEYIRSILHNKTYFPQNFEHRLLNRTTENDISNVLKLAFKIQQKILKGTYLSENGNDYIIVEDKKIRLVNTSSGQQESLWILNFIILGLYQKVMSFTVIEEPEAHLFPKTQIDLMELVSLYQAFVKNQIIITTHSPYILEAFNNMIAAGEKGKEYPDKVNEIMPKEIWQNFDKVIAYNVENGGVENIMDDEIKQIKISYIDSVSKDINKQYDAIFDIQ